MATAPCPCGPLYADEVLGYGRSTVRAMPVIAVAAAAILFVAVHPLREALSEGVHGDVEGLRSAVQDAGLAGTLILVALILAHAVVLFPAETVNATAGIAYGFAGALPLLMLAWSASLLLAYWLGAVLGRPLAVRVAGERRVATAERLIDRGGAPALIVARVIPVVPYSLVGYVAGAARVPVWRYTWTSFVGILPVTVASTYFGHALDDISISDPLLWTSVGVVGASVALAVFVARRSDSGRSKREKS